MCIYKILRNSNLPATIIGYAVAEKPRYFSGTQSYFPIERHSSSNGPYRVSERHKRHGNKKNGFHGFRTKKSVMYYMESLNSRSINIYCVIKYKFEEIETSGKAQISYITTKSVNCFTARYRTILKECDKK